ncbi:MAG: alpha/beta fold hydrolase [Acutalibacteraceae bacterium]|nr:alpha/beta fold hydrolase [Acutalibacteraceae bacterium]
MLHKEYIRLVEGSDTVVLFIHGILGSPNIFNKYIEKTPKDWSVYNMLLDGHGKTVKDFAHSSMKKWKRQVDRTVYELSMKYDKIMIVGHSMGTLLAINSTKKYPSKIKQLFFLAVPLKIFLRPIAPLTALKVVFDEVSDNDPVAIAMRDGYSIQIEKNLFVYISWLPRYMELFKESRATRARVNMIDVPCNVYLSKKDDMVSIHSSKYFENNERIKLSVLENSLHMYFVDDEMNFLLKEFDEACKRVINLKK